MPNVFDVLRERGFIEQVSDEGLREILGRERMTCYIGFDPSASSLHTGNLLPIMGLVHWQRNGHRPIALVGGGTGMIGDPSGKSQERNLLGPEEIEANEEGIREQLARFLDFDDEDTGALMLNNADWLASYLFLDFLRDVGKYFTVNYMLAKESVKGRMDREEGISFTEFSYMLLQAYDFMHLYDAQGCTCQMGGVDQWGNITAGIDLTRRLRSKTVYGIVFPLITTATGQKLGKTEEGTVWLDAERTSPYQFYQYWMQTDDRDVIRYLGYFTFLPMEEILGLAEATRTSPDAREAQRVLAYEVTKLVHGRDAAESAVGASRVLFGEEISGVSDRDLMSIFSDVPSTTMARTELDAGVPVLDLATRAGIAKSRSEARRLVSGGGLYVNNRRVDSVERTITLEDLASQHIMVLRSGKKRYHLLKFE